MIVGELILKGHLTSYLNSDDSQVAQSGTVVSYVESAHEIQCSRRHEFLELCSAPMEIPG